MFPRLPTVTKALLIANAILFLLQQPFLLGMQTFEPFMLQPLQQGFDAFSPGGNFQPWQLLTYGFLHGSFGHLFFNKFGLSAASLWPIFIALGWMQGRFAEIGLPLPFFGWEINYVFFFLLNYIPARILFSRLKRRLPYFRGVHETLLSYEKMDTCRH